MLLLPYVPRIMGGQSETSISRSADKYSMEKGIFELGLEG